MPSISLSEKANQLQNFPCFRAFDSSQLLKLANLLEEIHVQASEIIVMEQEVVDSVYFIMAGKAEVTRAAKRSRRIKQVPIAILHEGEAIGLNDDGFYSKTGIRTATVTALTEMILLRLSIASLNQFLKDHHLEMTMSIATAKMLNMNFIKQSLPFSNITPQRLEWLESKIYEKKVLAGETIFRQGDPGSECYLIKSGQVEILKENKKNKTSRQLVILNPPVLFGEATLITHQERNATAIAITDCELLVLNQNDLTELLETEQNVANMFVALMIDRSRPVKNPDVLFYTRLTADGQRIAILKNPNTGNYFKLSNEGAFIWHQLDGEHTMKDITLALSERFKIFSPDTVVALISKLNQFGFIENIETVEVVNQKTFLQRSIKFILSIFSWRYAIGDADWWITKTYQHFIKFFINKFFHVVATFVIIFGFIIFIDFTPIVLSYFQERSVGFWVLLSLIPFSVLEVVAHELGHAYAVKACGREVHYIGFGWSKIAPMAFTDTSDMWLEERKARMWVTFAGIYVDAFIAGVASLSILLLPDRDFYQSMFWLFALYTYLRAIKMLSPLQELDGYYLLMDWLEKSRLQESSVLWLVKQFSKKTPLLNYKYKAEKLYWAACVLYLIFISAITLLVQNFILRALGFENKHMFLLLLAPVVVVFYSSARIIFAVKNKVES